TFRWRGASSTSPPWSTGSAARSWRGSCRSRYLRISASRPWRMRLPALGGRVNSTKCNKVLKNAEIAISMDGKGAWRDNVFVERLWRTVKYEEVYLRAYASVSEARASIGRYLGFYNSRRPHFRLEP